ncbi:hypothetical protein Tco_0759930 [Tanacetum coccineum]
MAPKRTSTSAAPPMTQDAIKKLVADSVAAALEAQAATMENTNNTNRNTRQSGTPIARKCSYKEFMICQPFNFKGNDLKTYIRRFQELAVLCPTMVPNTEKLMKVFIGGLPRSIEGNVTTSKPQTLEEAITITQRLMDQDTIGMLEVFLCIKDTPCITQDLALSSVRFATTWVIRPRTAETKGQPLEATCSQCHFDVVIGMDWLSKYHAKILCDEKVVHIPIDDEILIIRVMTVVAMLWGMSVLCIFRGRQLLSCFKNSFPKKASEGLGMCPVEAWFLLPSVGGIIEIPWPTVQSEPHTSTSFVRARSFNNAQDSLALRSRSLPPADWSMDIIVEFYGPSRWKKLSKESGSKILPCGDGSCWKAFKPIASLIAKGKLK